MKRFIINGGPVLLFEDQLWIPALAEATIHSGGGAVTAQNEEVAPEPIKKQGRPKKPKPADAGDIEAIKRDLRAGDKPGAIAIRHNVPYWKVMYARKQMKDAGEEVGHKSVTEIREDHKAPKQFECMKGHKFATNLKQQEAKCPDCGSKAFRELKDYPTL